MKSTQWIIISLLWLLPISYSYANSGWTSISYIDEIHATTAGRVIIHAKFKDNPSRCRKKQTFYLDYTNRGSDQAYQLLLEAAIHSQPIKLFVSGRCDIKSRHEFTSVKLIPRKKK